MTTSEQEPISVEVVEHTISHLASYPSILCALVVIVSAIQMIRAGVTLNLVVLCIGSVLTLAGIILYSVSIIIYSIPKKKSFLAMLMAITGFLPWIFGSYLVFYKGLWLGISLFQEFSFLNLIKHIGFVGIGYVIVLKFYKITEIDRAIAEGQINIAIEESHRRNAT
ncbi:MAG: hypothetical protein HY033_12550 [Ignavibacteriae bacterium]|nr:hypothetical protein [Ignavibacteria bacterium]MBI3365723.1 hypothetical protein [Ignavibacteriota bacterium]